MKKSIGEILNRVNIEKINSVKIDSENEKVDIELLDYQKKPYNLELFGVKNYHFIDDCIFEDDKLLHEGQDSHVKKVSFYDSSPWEYKCLTFDNKGKLINETRVEPNFIINSKDKSFCLSATSAKLDGDSYPVFKTRIFNDNNKGNKHKC